MCNLEQLVDFQKIKKLNKILTSYQLKYYWQNNLTFDEAMIISYWRNPEGVYENTVQSDSLDRHRKHLLLWRRLFFPIKICSNFNPYKDISPEAQAGLKKLGIGSK